jgi:hypothetical protein
VVNKSENTLFAPSSSIVMLYVIGVVLSRGTVSGLIFIKFLKSLEKFHVEPTPDDNSKFGCLSNALLADTTATRQGCISQWYTKSPALLKVYWKNEFAVAGIIPELNSDPESELPGFPLVTVCGCPGSLLNHATVVPVGTAIAGGK